jgi:nucleotide-binding universal stress UspA family protein
MLNRITRIVYASDLNHGSRPAFRMAVELAIQHKARLYFVHVIEPFSESRKEIIESYLPEGVSLKHLNDTLGEHKERITQRIADFLDTELTDEITLPYPPEAIVLVNSPEQGVLSAAHQQSADLIVMGARKTSAASRLFLGSTAHKVMNKTDIPVLIVPLNTPSQHD